MPVKLDICVRKIKKKIKSGEIPKTYIKKGKRVKTSAWAICKKRRKK